jgi:hypothetical protein
LIVEPIPESAFVWVTGDSYGGFRSYSDMANIAEEQRLELIHAGYFYRGHYYTSGTPEFDSLLARLNDGLEALSHVDVVEVPTREKVKDWGFSLKLAAYTAIGFHVAVWISAFLMRAIL